MNFEEFEAISFDCYGTLIDWETGIFESLSPILRKYRVHLDREKILERYGQIESELERQAYRPYREILKNVLVAFGQQLKFSPQNADLESFARSITDWQPFPDTVESLNRLHKKYKLAVISNVDNDLFSATAKHLKTSFDWIVTAEMAKCYSPFGCSRGIRAAEPPIPDKNRGTVVGSLKVRGPSASFSGFWRMSWANIYSRRSSF